MEYYLDNAATTRPCAAAVDAANRCFTENYGNASSLHRHGLMAEREIAAARDVILSTLSAESGNLYFTSGGTESNNLAIMGVVSRLRHKGKLITTALEHPSVLRVFEHLQQNGHNAVIIPADAETGINIEAFAAECTSDTQLVSCTQVNNETGVIMPLGKIKHIMEEKCPDALLHTDATQGFCKLPSPIPLADLVTVSAHKVHGIKGAGALYVRKGVLLNPIMHGGEQQSGIRSGTENVPAIAAFGAAVKELSPLISENYTKMTMLKTLLAGILNSTGKVKLITATHCSPYIFAATVKNAKAETLLHMAEQRGVYIGTGSACSSRKAGRNATLAALGYSAKDIEGSIRVSFSPYSQAEEVMEAGEILKAVILEY